MLSLFLLLLPLAAALPSLSLDGHLQGKPIGQPTSNGVVRYSLKYATAKRWAAPIMSNTWVPSIGANPTALPLACPQTELDLSQVSEDCLDVVLYVPPTAKTTRGGVPTIVWVHGGSFIVGSASGPGLDGSNLAVGTNTIVVVVQYRLGVLGLLPPQSSSTTINLAIQDVTMALKFLHTVLPSFGGAPSTPHLTLAGQSSGASLVRALLGTPDASQLFSSAWLHSDPLDYGFLTAPALKTLRTEWLSELGCASGNGCAQNMDLSSLLAHQIALLNASAALGPEFFPSEPLRPSPAGESIAHTLTKPGTFPASRDRKPLVVSTVRDEAAIVVYSNFPYVLPAEAYAPALASVLGDSRSAAVIAAPFYGANWSDVRVPLQTVGTDEVWRCTAWRLARNWSPTKAYVGVFTRGVTYPGNDLCPSIGAVCHQDDIMVLFGTGGQDSEDVRRLTRELHARYAAFVRSGSPNAPGLETWRAVAGRDTCARDLGAGGVYPEGACTASFWGEGVLFDYQVLEE